jgi:hypothetical protein
VVVIHAVVPLMGPLLVSTGGARASSGPTWKQQGL